jgi:hypothetical protein
MFFDSVELSEGIKKSYDRFMEIIKLDERSEKLVKMYDDYGDVLITAPASGKTHYHNAFPGGYIDHVMRVFDCSLDIVRMYKKMGGTLGFTAQELSFAALHHDLGKLGEPHNPYYTEQDSDWHRKRGELYKINDNMQYFKVPDRALKILQSYEITLTETEWLAIKLSDGMYYEGNKAYLTNQVPFSMKTKLPYIIHWADHMATLLEKDRVTPSFNPE